MSNQTVRFTGKRTGRASYVIPRVGLVELGDEFEVDEATAASFCTLHATREGEMLADFEIVEADGTPESEEEADTSSGDSDEPKVKGSRKRTIREPEVTADTNESSAETAEGGQ